MEGTGIVAVIGLVLTLVVLWWKKRESPEAKRERILKALEERVNEGRKAIETPGIDDDNRRRAGQHGRVMRETEPRLYDGSGDKKE